MCPPCRNLARVFKSHIWIPHQKWLTCIFCPNSTFGILSMTFIVSLFKVIDENISAWSTLFHLNCLTALEGTHFYLFFREGQWLQMTNTDKS